MKRLDCVRNTSTTQNGAELIFSESLMKISYRIVFACLVVLAATAHLLTAGYRDWETDGSSYYVGLMLFLFFGNERIEDERTNGLRLKALTVSFVVGYSVVVAVYVVVTSQKLVGFPRIVSAFDFMLVMLIVAFSLFHFWRWQDSSRSCSG